MKLKRILAVVAARNREFYRDRAGLGWNIFMPVVMVLGFAFIFSGPEKDLFKVGTLGEGPAEERPAFLDTRHIRFVQQENLDTAVEKVRYHRLDLLLDLRGTPRYWVNELSPNGYVVERLLLQAQVILQETQVIQAQL